MRGSTVSVHASVAGGGGGMELGGMEWGGIATGHWPPRHNPLLRAHSEYDSATPYPAWLSRASWSKMSSKL